MKEKGIEVPLRAVWGLIQGWENDPTHGPPWQRFVLKWLSGTVLASEGKGEWQHATLWAIENK